MRIIKFVLWFFASLLVVVTLLVTVVYYRVPKLESPVSILVLGKGGEGHTAPNLTDTMMFAYLNNNSMKLSLLSLPRDMWIPEIRAKINTAYHYGGFKMAGDSVTSITGRPMNFTIVVDFSLFKDLVDSIGGVEVNVDNSFIDNKYPIEGKENDLCNGDRLYRCRYETLEIKSGFQHMDGTLALKFVRSRNAEGEEGTDLAREKRQQKVIEAIKNKLLSLDFMTSPQKMRSLYNVFVTHVETDVDTVTFLKIVRFAIESNFNIDFLNIPDEMLTVSQNNKKYDNQYVFLPASGTWTEFQQWVKERM